MTLTAILTSPAVTHLAVLGAGYLAGRRAFRRKLQTTEGRRRAGHAHDDLDLDGELAAVVQLDDRVRTEEIPETAAMGEVHPDTVPQHTVAIPRPRAAR